LARGLGSSATAIVGGLIAANQLANSPLSLGKLIDLAIAIEGHPDNVVPALLGGCRLAATSQTGWEICDLAWHHDIIPVLAIPEFELSTAAARRVLPSAVSREDAVFNIAHLGLLLRGLATNHREWLRAGLQDKLHQPYRQTLIPGYEAIATAAVASGAYGLVISGAGPTLLALTDRANADQVAEVITNVWEQQGIKSVVRSLALDNQGAVILEKMT
jgi:homoserine kinase